MESGEECDSCGCINMDCVWSSGGWIIMFGSVILCNLLERVTLWLDVLVFLWGC